MGRAVGGADHEEDQIPRPCVHQVQGNVEAHIGLAEQFGPRRDLAAALCPQPIVGHNDVGAGIGVVQLAFRLGRVGVGSVQAGRIRGR